MCLVAESPALAKGPGGGICAVVVAPDLQAQCPRQRRQIGLELVLVAADQVDRIAGGAAGAGVGQRRRRRGRAVERIAGFLSRAGGECLARRLAGGQRDGKCDENGNGHPGVTPVAGCRAAQNVQRCA